MKYIVITKICKNCKEYYADDHWSKYRTYDIKKAYHFQNFKNACNFALHNDGFVQAVKH